MSFDTERFICELETRRALWDMSCVDYSNRDIKRILWEEITEIFSTENSTINEKKELCKYLFYCMFILLSSQSNSILPRNYSFANEVVSKLIPVLCRCSISS